MIGRVDVSWNGSTRTDTRYYYLKDHLGSTRVEFDRNASVRSAYGYYSYGQISQSYNNSNPNDKYKFTGKERDTETNYDYFGARYYDSELGRWLQVDPLAAKYPGWSPYNYTLNNPLRFIDPNGKEVKIYSRWSGPKLIGSDHRHLFIVVRNSETGVYTSRSLMPAGGPLEGVTTAIPGVKGDKTPVIMKDMGKELGRVARQDSGEKDIDVHFEMVVQPPDGMSEAEYDYMVLKAADDYNVKNRPYDADEGPNSNTYVDDVIESTGVELPQFEGATQQKWEDEKKNELKQNNN